jgi:diaphanous protein
MKASVNNTELDLKNYKRSTDKNDIYFDMMEAFVKEALSRYETLECMFNKMNDVYKELADFYAFEVSKYPLGEFFTDLKTFCTQFQQCADENIKLKETEEKIKRSEEERQQREKEKQARKTKKDEIMKQSSKQGGGETGVMDNLLEALQSGKLFEAPAGNAGSGANSGMGRGKRVMRRDHNLMGLIFFYKL